jgi:GTP diphosphokinase / guanosine-3',5'-bis(diphosphate) 3'-diphosphatase
VHLYKQLHKKLNYLEADQIEQIHQAYLIAVEAHLGQKRDGGESYIIHPVAVACILADMHIDCQSIIAALLHDVIEDTPTTKEKIISHFGQTVADLVDGVTKLTKIEASSKDENYAESFRKMFLAMSRDIRVILIKLADRRHNMQTISSVAPHKRRRIAQETLDIYAPIANRLGMYDVCIELENLAFAAIYPRRYRVLKEAMEQDKGSHKEVLLTIEKELKRAFVKMSLNNVIIVGRKKHLYGIYKKMLDRHISFTNIMDVYAFRITMENIGDCYRALGVVHGLYKPVPGKFKDYIAIPKANGYQSLHTNLFGPHSVPIEIQIRTRAMDQMANKGIAAHWLYKSDDKTAKVAHVRAQQWVNNLLEMQQNTSCSLEFMENVRVDLFSDAVYLFTPKGSIMELPRGATAVDFAYAVHTDIGNTCVSVRVDRKFSPLSTVLFNGQIISIVTSPSAKPNPEWLKFVVTSKARSGIRNYLKNQKRSELMALGKQLLNKSFSDLQLDLKTINPDVISNFLKNANLKEQDDLYEDIGLGNRSAVFVAHQLVANAAKEQTEVFQSSESKPLLIHGADGTAINFASCCCPIPGDSIVGFINKGHGLDIHIVDCTNQAKLRKQPEKWLPVSWADDVRGNFRVALDVEAIHRIGGLAELAGVITKTNAFVDDIGISERSGGYCLVSLRLLVKNLSHLNRVLRHISKASVVIGAMRKKGG